MLRAQAPWSAGRVADPRDPMKTPGEPEVFSRYPGDFSTFTSGIFQVLLSSTDKILYLIDKRCNSTYAAELRVVVLP